MKFVGRRTLFSGVLIAAMMGMHASAEAGEPAEVLFREGRAALAAGEDRRACELFEHAVALGEAFGPLANLGACMERRAEWALAWSLFDRAGRVARPEMVAFADEAKARAAARIALVRLPASSGTLELDGKPVDPNQAIHALLPGRHLLRVSLGGAAATDARAFVAGEQTTWLPPPISKPTGRSIVGPTMTFGGGALVVLGLVAGAVALGGRDAAATCVRESGDRRACPSSDAAGQATRAKTFANLATVGVLSGLAIGGVGVAFWATRDTHANTGAMLTLSGAF
jgi:hypothetical protein